MTIQISDIASFSVRNFEKTTIGITHNMTQELYKDKQHYLVRAVPLI